MAYDFVYGAYMGNLLVGILMAVLISVGAIWFFRMYFAVSAKSARYKDLYELHKLEESLKKRGLSFEELDALDLRTNEAIKRGKNRLEEIDSEYAEEAKK